MLRAQRDGDPAARAELVRRHLPLARSLARRYHRRGEQFDDLVQVASVGLLKAIDRFDLDRGTAFATYAVPTILGELRRYLRDCSWTLYVPRSLQERALMVRDAREQLTGELRRTPTTSELGDHLGLSSADVLAGLEAYAAYEPLSLDATLSSVETESTALGDRLGHEDEQLERVEHSAALAPHLAGLTAREQAVLRLRFEEDLSQTATARRLGMSQMQVSRLERRSIALLQATAA